MNKCKRQFYNKVAAVLVCVAATCLFFACSRDDHDDSSKEKTEKPQPGFEVAKSRTVMVYIAADNSLDTNVARDVTEILKGFSKYDLGAGCPWLSLLMRDAAIQRYMRLSMVLT